MNSIVYEEVNMVIEVLPEGLKDKLPAKLNDFLSQFPSRIHLNSFKDIRYIELSKNATIVLTDLLLNYWCKNEEKKLEILNIFKKNKEIQSYRKNSATRQKEINKNFLALADATSDIDKDKATSETMKNLIKKLLEN